MKFKIFVCLIVLVKSISTEIIYFPLNVYADQKVIDEFKYYEDLAFYLKNVLNQVNQYYRPANIEFQFQWLLLLDNPNYINQTVLIYEALERITLFKKRIGNIYHANPTIYISNSLYHGSVIGTAYIGTICENERSITTVMYTSDLTKLSYVIAHELGHMLYLQHLPDYGTEPDCYNVSCIMSSSIQSLEQPIRFSLKTLSILYDVRQTIRRCSKYSNKPLIINTFTQLIADLKLNFPEIVKKYIKEVEVNVFQREMISIPVDVVTYSLFIMSFYIFCHTGLTVLKHKLRVK